MATKSDIEDLKTELQYKFDEYKALAEAELTIDEFNLDGESIRTPKLHSRWLGFLCDEGVKLKQIQNLSKSLYLERWKYWSGKASDQYYAKHGPVHEKILKTDLDIYLNADVVLSTMKEVLEQQNRIVDFLERSVKEITSRTFHIKSAIDWRKFESGA
jgi:hypothetical protein